jgi:hypothetical protein
MPRRRIPNVSVPRRPDRRRVGGNAIGAQHRPPRGRRGQVETIAERRAIALELRKAGAPYREIARQLGIDLHTAHADIDAELSALRETTVERAEALRALELGRFDRMVEGLWPQIEKGSPPAVCAAIRVSERRSRLIGLDEPTHTRTELSGSLGVTTDTQLKALREDLLQWLDFDELRTLAEASDQLFTNAMALVAARKTGMGLAVSPSPAAAVAESSAVVETAIEVARANGATLDAPAARCGGVREASGPQFIGAGVSRPGDGDPALDQDSKANAPPVGVSTSPAAAVENVATGAPAEPSIGVGVDDA